VFHLCFHHPSSTFFFSLSLHDALPISFALFSLLVIPSFPFYKSIHPLNLIPLNGPFVELLFNKIIFPFPIPHCNNRKSIFIGFFVIICMNQIAFFCVIKV